MAQAALDEKIEQDLVWHKPISNTVFTKMCMLALAGLLGFYAVVIEFGGLGGFGGFSQHEFTIDIHNRMKTSVLPYSIKVASAFYGKNIYFRDIDTTISRLLRKHR